MKKKEKNDSNNNNNNINNNNNNKFTFLFNTATDIHKTALYVVWLEDWLGMCTFICTRLSCVCCYFLNIIGGHYGSFPQGPSSTPVSD